DLMKSFKCVFDDAHIMSTLLSPNTLTHTHTHTQSFCRLTCIKVNSLQLRELPTEGRDATARSESSPRARMPAATYSTTLHTSSPTHATARPPFTCRSTDTHTHTHTLA